MTNFKFEAFKGRLKTVLIEIDKLSTVFPLHEYLTKEAFKKIVKDTLNKCDDAEEFQSYDALRSQKENPSDRTHHITVNGGGDFIAILDTKGKTETNDKKNRIIAEGAKKKVKPSFRIDVWPPEEYVSAVSYGPDDVKLAKEEVKTANTLNTPFHQSLLISADYAHLTKGVANAIFSKKRDTLNDKIKDLNYVSRYVISYGLTYALRFMHEKEGKVYGDISPANILTSEHAAGILRPYLTDFGTTTTPGKTAHATPGYESPELFCHLIQTKAFQNKFDLNEPDSLSRGYARKRRNMKVNGEFAVKGESYLITYPPNPAENSAAKQNDVWSLGIILYQIFNKGKVPTYQEFTQNSHDPFYDKILTETRLARADIKTVMNEFLKFMMKNHINNQGVLFEIIDVLMSLSNDPYYHSELVRDIYLNCGKDAISHMIIKGLDIKAVLKTSLTNNNATVLKAICELQLDLSDFAEECVNETDVHKKAFLFKHIVKENWAVLYILENIFKKSEEVQKAHLYLLYQHGYPIEGICASYIEYDFSPHEKTTKYMDRLRTIYSMAKKPSGYVYTGAVPKLQIDLDYSKILRITQTKSTQCFAHTVKVLNDLGVDTMSSLRYIGIRAKDSQQLLHFAINSGVDLKPLFIEALSNITEPLYRQAILGMLEVGYGKTDREFVTTYVTKALRIVIVDAPSVAEAQSRLIKYGSCYEDCWDWTDTTGKLFTSYMLSFNQILTYENQVNGRFFERFREKNKATRLKTALTIIQFILGAEKIDVLVRKLEDALSKFETMHKTQQGRISLFFEFQSGLAKNLEQAVTLVKNIQDDTLTPAKLGTTTPLSNATTAISKAATTSIKVLPKSRSKSVELT
jgi:hypothetical protein